MFGFEVESNERERSALLGVRMEVNTFDGMGIQFENNYKRWEILGDNRDGHPTLQTILHSEASANIYEV